jgi:hypothetical protein
MKRFTTLLATAAIGVAGAASAADVTLADVDVIVEFEDAENANAQEFWPAIETDLETVFAAKTAAMHSDEGLDVNVRLTEVSLSGSQILTGEGEFNHMEGWVYVREQGDPDPLESFKVIIDAKTGSAGIIEGMVIVPDMQDFYVALLNGFADKTLQEIEEE